MPLLSIWAISLRPVFIDGGSRTARKKHRSSRGKLTILVNKDYGRVHPHERGSNSQPQL